jgi:hypothetical protein
MIWDVQNLFSDQQALTVTANSTNVIDLMVARDVGPGEDVFFLAMVNTQFTASGAGTLIVALVAADSADLATNPTTLFATAALPKATLAPGYRVRFRVPRNTVYPTGQRYLGVVYTVATGPMTAGKITAGLTLEAQDDSDKFYPRAAYAVA